VVGALGLLKMRIFVACKVAVCELIYPYLGVGFFTCPVLHPFYAREMEIIVIAVVHLLCRSLLRRAVMGWILVILLNCCCDESMKPFACACFEAFCSWISRLILVLLKARVMDRGTEKDHVHPDAVDPEPAVTYVQSWKASYGSWEL
jgi:hypothetical protein